MRKHGIRTVDDLSTVQTACLEEKKAENHLRWLMKQRINSMTNSLAIFEGHKIRRHYDEHAETWHFSVIDIIQVQAKMAEMLKTIER